jgi:type II secretory pathway pseudopilin PulG
MDGPITDDEGIQMTKRISEESGFTLVESLIAIIVLLAGLLSMAQVLAYTVIASKTHGHDSATTTSMAQDKMEELINLRFNDKTTNLTVNAPYPTTGKGLTAGGSIPPNNPVAGYADYLNRAGQRTTVTSQIAFTRQWQITNDASGLLKTIAVNVTSNKSFDMGGPPSTTLVTLKTPTSEVETP